MLGRLSSAFRSAAGEVTDAYHRIPSVPQIVGSAVSEGAKAAAMPVTAAARGLWNLGVPQAMARGAVATGVGAARVGGYAASFAARQAAVVGIGGTLGVARTGYAAARTGYQALRWVGGGRVVDWHEVGKIGGFTLKEPKLRNRVEDLLVGGALAGAVGLGALDVARGQLPAGGWQLTQAAADGYLEIENPNFLSATGSLALSLHRQRHGRRGLQTGEEYHPTTYSRATGMAHALADDGVMLAARMFR